MSNKRRHGIDRTAEDPVKPLIYRLIDEGDQDAVKSRIRSHPEDAWLSWGEYTTPQSCASCGDIPENRHQGLISASAPEHPWMTVHPEDLFTISSRSFASTLIASNAKLVLLPSLTIYGLRLFQALVTTPYTGQGDIFKEDLSFNPRTAFYLPPDVDLDDHMIKIEYVLKAERCASFTMETLTDSKHVVHDAVRYDNESVGGINWRRYIIRKYPEQAKEINNERVFPLHLALNNRQIVTHTRYRCCASSALFLIRELVQLNNDALGFADTRGFLPLHLAINSSFLFDLEFLRTELYRDLSELQNDIKGYDLLIEHYPRAVRTRMPNNMRLPLHVVVEKIPLWEYNIEQIANKDHDLLLVRDPKTKLYPFQIAATAYSKKSRFNIFDNIGVIYGLLRMRPEMEVFWHRDVAV